MISQTVPERFFDFSGIILHTNRSSAIFSAAVFERQLRQQVSPQDDIHGIHDPRIRNIKLPAATAVNGILVQRGEIEIPDSRQVPVQLFIHEIPQKLFCISHIFHDKDFPLFQNPGYFSHHSQVT